MKKKIVAMALSVVLGLSMFGGVAQARVAPGCAHTSLKRVDAWKSAVQYDPASELFHNTLYAIPNVCTTPNCGYTEYDYEWVCEDHDFQRIYEGYWVCICGEVDESNHY